MLEELDLIETDPARSLTQLKMAILVDRIQKARKEGRIGVASLASAIENAHNAIQNARKDIESSNGRSKVKRNLENMGIQIPNKGI